MEGHRNRIVIFGTGNVATHLAVALDKVADVVQVWGRRQDAAVAIADRLRNAQPITSQDKICRDADIYLLAVADDAIARVASMLRNVSGIVAHTSGSIDIDVLTSSTGSQRCGVMYPLQTFSVNLPVDTSDIPFLIEGTDDDATTQLLDLARSLGSTSIKADSAKRAHIHLAAVFANNFANYMWDIAAQHLEANTDTGFQILAPLLRQTVSKAIAVGPHYAQTGPAVRGDISVTEAQAARLAPDKAAIYRLITQNIINDHLRQDNE